MIYFFCLIACAAAYIVSRWLAGAAGAWGQRRGIVSEVNERSSHVKPTSRLAGAGLMGGVLAGFIIWLLLWRFTHGSLGDQARLMGWIVVGWLMMFAIGLLDDLYDLKPLFKLNLSIVAAALPVIGGLRWFPVNGPGLPHGLPLLPLLGAAVALGWILFFVNAYNFMDGMDGFAGNFARYSSLFICIAAARGHFVDGAPWTAYAALPLILAASASGFLVWNSPPAKFFMGDGGSLSTGYLLAIFVLLGRDQQFGGRVSFVAAQIILLPFTFDVVLTLIRRARRGENLLKAHRSHLYQRLMQTGLSHAQVLRINIGLFIACGALGVIAAPLPLALGLALAAAAFASMSLYWRQVLARERFFSS